MSNLDAFRVSSEQRLKVLLQMKQYHENGEKFDADMFDEDTDVSKTTAHTVLKDGADQGYLEPEDESMFLSGRPKRWYRLSDSGLERLNYVLDVAYEQVSTRAGEQKAKEWFGEIR